MESAQPRGGAGQQQITTIQLARHRNFLLEAGFWWGRVSGSPLLHEPKRKETGQTGAQLECVTDGTGAGTHACPAAADLHGVTALAY